MTHPDPTQNPQPPNAQRAQPIQPAPCDRNRNPPLRSPGSKSGHRISSLSEGIKEVRAVSIGLEGLQLVVERV